MIMRRYPFCMEYSTESYTDILYFPQNMRKLSIIRTFHEQKKHANLTIYTIICISLRSCDIDKHIIDSFSKFQKLLWLEKIVEVT